MKRRFTRYYRGMNKVRLQFQRPSRYPDATNLSYCKNSLITEEKLRIETPYFKTALHDS